MNYMAKVIKQIFTTIIKKGVSCNYNTLFLFI